mgnify:CR=1 FL=1
MPFKTNVALLYPKCISVEFCIEQQISSTLFYELKNAVARQRTWWFFIGGGGLLYFLKMKYKEHINIYPLLSLESFVECSDY